MTFQVSESTGRSMLQRMISFLLLFAMILTMLPLQAIAADYNVDSADTMVSSWNSASSNSDASNNFNVTSNIDMSGHGLTTSSDKTYNIQTNNNSEISHLGISAGDSTGAVVNIQTDVTTDTIDSALTVGGDVTVVVSEDVVMDIANDNDRNPNYVIQAVQGADITVMGDVISNDGGPLLIMDSELTVNGDLVTEGQISVGDESELNVRGDLISEEGADEIGQFSGVYVTGESTMTVEGKTETPLLFVSGNSDVSTGPVESHAVVVGFPMGGESDGTDASTLKVNGDITNDTNDTFLNAAQKSVTNVNGNVDGTVYAIDNARVTLAGTAQEIIKEGKAKVYTKANTGSTHTSNVVKQDNEDITALCLNMGKANSPMQQHLKNLDDLRSIAASELLDDLGLGDAFLISVFHHEDINLSNLAIISTSELDNTDLYHSGSVSALQERYSEKRVATRTSKSKITWEIVPSYDLSRHEISQYKKHLANSIADVKTAVKPDSETKKMLNTISDIVSSFFGFCDDANPNILSKDQLNFLEKASKNGISLKEAKDFLTKYRGFDLGNKDLDKAAMNLRDMFKMGSSVKTKINAAKNVSTANTLIKSATCAFHAADFVEYWFTNHECQVQVLDTMLKEQSLTPEMFVAVAQLRDEYEHKFLGSFTKGVEKGFSLGTSLLKGTWFAFSAAETLVSIGGAVSGLTAETEALYTAVSQCSISPVAIEAYRNAIQKVANGDTSPDAINMVKMTYSIVKNCLTDLCNGMVKNGEKDEVTYYKRMLNTLNDLQIGEVFDLSKNSGGGFR